MQRITKDAGACLRRNFGQRLKVDNKGDVDLVTNADREAESKIISGILDRHPEDGVLGEESGTHAGSNEYRWVVDPLDGTTNFAHNNPHFAVSVALTHFNKTVAGMVYDPIKNELFEAQLGSGSFCNGSPIHISDTKRLDRALCVSGFSYDRRQRLPILLDRVERALHYAQGFRRLGSAALDLVYVASGRFDVFWEDGLNEWDMAAGALIAHEAGARVTLLDGKEFDGKCGEVLACNPHLHCDVITKIINPSAVDR